MDYKEFKDIVIAACKDAGIEDYELYFSKEEDISIEIYKEEVSHFSSDTNSGVTLRVIVNENAGSASCELFTEESAQDLVNHAIDNAACIETEEHIEFLPPAESYQQVNTEIQNLSTSDELIRKALECQKLTYQESDKIADGTQTYTASSYTSISLCNAKGINLNHSYSYDLIDIAAIVTDGKEMYTEDSLAVNRLDRINSKELVQKTVANALASMNPVKIASGKYNVVISGKTMATILQTFASIFSGEYAQQGLSLLANKQNTCVASDCITLIDDPFYADSLIQMPFDAEGLPTYTKNIIENGILKTLLYDLKSARKDKVTPTGNAVRQNYASPIAIKPYNFYFKAGTKSLNTLFENLQDGLFITELQGMHSGANPETGDFSLASGGYLIKNGKKANPVKGFTVSGNFYSLLKQIKSFSDEVEFNQPRGCTLYGSAAALIEEVSIAGE